MRVAAQSYMSPPSAEYTHRIYNPILELMIRWQSQLYIRYGSPTPEEIKPLVVQAKSPIRLPMPTHHNCNQAYHAGGACCSSHEPGYQR